MRRTSMSANTELAAKLAAATGLDVRTTETGGGNTALMATLPGQWNDPDAANVLITSAQDPSFPLHVADEGTADGYVWGVHVGAYAPGAAYDEPETLLVYTDVDASIERDTDLITDNVARSLTEWRTAQSTPAAQLAGE